MSTRATGYYVGSFLLFLASGCAQPGTESKHWSALFNGRDLSGWTVLCQPQDRAKVFWTVDNGAILCDSIGRKDHNYVWLVSDREFADFELKLKFQAYRQSTGNSGVQFRSRYDPTVEGGWLHGPQVDIHPPAEMSWRTGLVYDETLEERRWVFPSLKDWQMPLSYQPANHIFHYADDPESWNELTLLCQGMHVKTTVNGIVRTDWEATGVLDNAAHVKRNVGRRGHFALQLHTGDELRIRFKEIQLREIQ